jgi:Zn finger protein HypA/HybF involved in hydrogenase expression
VNANPLDVLRATTVALSRLERRPPRWECRACASKFDQPSYSDASDVIHNHDTGFEEYKHLVVAVCPSCFSEHVRTLP